MIDVFRKAVAFKSRLNKTPTSIIRSRLLNIDADISDFFVFSLGEYETVFVAENNLALLLGEHVSCTHKFHFFDASGVLCGVYEVENEEFHYRLKIEEGMVGGVNLGGFTHHVSYSDTILSQYNNKMLGISFQHRGYTGYRKTGLDEFSYVHGNFGAMYLSKYHGIRSLARSRSKHTYTPQFVVKPGFEYDLFFINPTNKKMLVNFVLIKNGSTKTLSQAYLNPRATCKVQIDNIDSESNVAWETSLPIGRCVVFERRGDHFDVFHS